MMRKTEGEIERKWKDRNRKCEIEGWAEIYRETKREIN